MWRISPLEGTCKVCRRIPTCASRFKTIDHGIVGTFILEEFELVHSLTRTEMLIGSDGLEMLSKSTVAVFGVGGVGSFAAEALARCGVGRIVLVDYDVVCITNINRQVHATVSTIGRPKVDVMKERINDINPSIEVLAYRDLYNQDTAERLLRPDYDYVIDAIDMVSSKIDLVVRCKSMGINIISSMGSGNKLDPTGFKVGDLFSTSVCPLARVMRQQLRKKGIDTLKVVYSTERPIKPTGDEPGDSDETNCPEMDNSGGGKRRPPGSIAFVPPVAGLIVAGEVVKDIIGYKPNR
jgi:tRNA A37 threonylcarbamoyladenosine dehydratase